MITPRELGWIAGFLEGEGSFRYRGNTPHVSAAQVQREPLERLHALIGGKIHQRSANKRGIYVWECYGKLAAGLLMTLYPMMSPRRKYQFSLALSPWRHRRTLNQYWSDQRNKMHCKRGHEFTTSNTYIDMRGSRCCRACHRLKDDARRRAEGRIVRGPYTLRRLDAKESGA